MVIGIDGYSRLITYLHCSNNNQANTVFQLFRQAVEECGIPSRVKSDHGLENFDIARWMIETRGVDCSSHITGSLKPLESSACGEKSTE